MRYILNETSYHGYGSLENIKEELKARGYSKAFICTDDDLIKYNVVSNVTSLLDEINFDYEIYSDIKANPTVKNVQVGVESFKQSNANVIIAIGGGSPQDTAKAIGIIAANPQFADVVSLEGVAPTKNKSVPIIAIPTTAGTASEVTINYVITDTENERKLVCVDNNAIPIVAIVDPVMMSTMPKSLAAATGMDALTHAIEGYITLAADEMSDMFHLKAIELIARSLKKACAEDEKAIADMALGQYIAGMGFSNVGLGAVHAMAHPLGALYDTPHGIANAIILPTVMEVNADFSGDKYKQIARAFGVEDVDQMTSIEYRDAAINAVRKLSLELEIPQDLKQIIKEEDLPFLAHSAFNDPCLGGNPKELSIEEIIEVYKIML